jgi:hypothetical protein
MAFNCVKLISNRFFSPFSEYISDYLYLQLKQYNSKNREFCVLRALNNICYIYNFKLFIFVQLWFLINFTYVGKNEDL